MLSSYVVVFKLHKLELQAYIELGDGESDVGH